MVTLGILVMVAMMAAASPADAREWFIDHDHPQARDDHDGTRERPFKTISGAVARARAGDILWIAAGTYRETVALGRGGSGPTKTIALRALPGNLVTLKGSDLVRGWVRYSDRIWRRPAWEVNSQQVFVDGAPLQQIGASSPLHHQIIFDGKPNLPAVGQGLQDMFPGTFWYDRAGSNLYVWLRDSGDPNAHALEASVRNWIIPPVEGVDYVELDGLHFSHGNQTAQGETMGLVNVWGNYWVISHCTFTYGDFSGLHITGEGHRLKNNIANYNGNTGIGINASDKNHLWEGYRGRPPQDIVLEENETSYNNYRNFYRHWHAGGIKAIPSCNTVSILKHKAIGNRGPGIWFDGWCHNIIIDRCIVSDNTVGIFYEISDNATISHNLVTRNTEQGIYVSSSNEVKVFNNTLVGNWASIVLHGIPRVPRPEHPELRNNTVRNNIICDSTWADLVISTAQPLAMHNSSDYNLYFGPEPGVKISWTGTPSYRINYRSLAAFTEATGLEAHSRWADPGFVGATAGDYALTGSSPAIDAGAAPVQCPGEKDLAGNPRIIGGKIDLGAYEYQGIR